MPLGERFFGGLGQAAGDPEEMDVGSEGAGTPKLTTPAIAELIVLARRGSNMRSADREVVLDAMRTAASKRVEAIVINKRRRHYSHAAALVACCLELAPAIGKGKAFAAWVGGVRKKYSRFHAFQAELTAALASRSA